MKTFIQSKTVKTQRNARLIKVAAFFAVLLIINVCSLCTHLFAFNQGLEHSIPENHQSLTAYNLTGEAVKSIEVLIDEAIALEDNFSDLTTGFYLVEVKTSDLSVVRSMVIE